MKFSKIITSAAAAFTAVSLMAASAFAFDVNKDFKTTWSANTTIPATEFADVTTDSVITFTYTADASLAEKEDHNYWVIKPMVNDTGWPLIKDLIGIDLSEGGDTYVVDTEKTKVSFSVSAETLELLQTSGMALMGHGVTLETMTVSNDTSLADVLAAEPNYSEEAAEEAPAAVNTTDSPVTGNTSAAVLGGIALMAAIGCAASRRK